MADRTLNDLADALLVDRFQSGTEPGHVKFSPVTSLGIEEFICHVPAWSEDATAAIVYAVAFEDGWLDLHRRIAIVLGLPEARGREREAIQLAIEPTVSISDFAVRLRAAASSVENSDAVVIPFPVRRRRPPEDPA